MDLGTSQQQVFRQILDVAESMKRLVARREQLRVPRTQAVEIPIPPLGLPSCDEIISSVDISCIPVHLSKLISEKIRTWATRVAQVHTESYQRTCQQVISNAPISDRHSVAIALDNIRIAFEKSFSDRYLARIKTVLEEAVAAARGAQSSHSRKKKPFNSEYTPLLEQYFEYNAYPSARDRALLARKSMMSPRQIEVWFQNHRTRAKKDGRILKRLSSSPLPVDIPLQDLERRMPTLTVPKQERTPTPSAQGEEFEDHTTTTTRTTEHFTPLTSELIPSHVFPAPYLCSCDTSNTVTSRASFPTPCWMRKPALVSKRAASPPDVDELAALFADKLHIRGPKVKQKARPQRSSPYDLSWRSSIVTRLPNSRHPALIPAVNSDPAAKRSLYPQRRTPVTRTLNRTPSTSSISSRLSSASQSSDESDRELLTPPTPCTLLPMVSDLPLESWSPTPSPRISPFRPSTSISTPSHPSSGYLKWLYPPVSFVSHLSI